jgi:hypothetical protein
VYTEAFSVRWPDAPHRVLRSCLEAAAAWSADTVGAVQRGESSMPLPRFGTAPPTRAATGEIDAMALYAGESVGAVRAVQPAGEIVRELLEEAAALLARWERVHPGGSPS